jgi:hypothetical protein
VKVGTYIRKRNMPVIPALERLRQEDQGKSGVHSKTFFMKEGKEERTREWRKKEREK